MKVTLARALKERSRIAGKLKRNFAIINKENSVIRGNERSFDLRAIYAECLELYRKLIEIKQIIATANAPIVGKLVEMDEVKSLIAQLRSIDTTVGYVNQGYGQSNDYMGVVFSASEMTAEADKLQERAEQLQDELDAFNALTKVDIP